MHQQFNLSRSLSAALAIGGIFASTPIATAQQDQAAQPAEQSAAETAPAAADLFERHIEALGGWDKLSQLTHRKLSGKFIGPPFASGARINVWQVKPYLSHVQLREPLGRSIDVFYNGEIGWEAVDDQAPIQRVGMQLAELVETADFLGEANYKDRYAEMETMGSVDFEQQPAWAVRVVSTLGRERVVFFSKETGLFLGEQARVLGPNAEPQTIIVALSEYESVDGVLYPMRQQQQVVGTNIRIEINYSSASNEPFEHDFSLPEDLVRVEEPEPETEGG